MEKVLHAVARRLLLVGFITLLHHIAPAQCTGGTPAGSISPTLSWQTIPCIKGGEYYTFNAVAGVYYTFSFCNGGGLANWDTQITILNSSGVPQPWGFADNDCGTQSFLWYWTPTTPGLHRVLVTEGPSCGSNLSCGTMAYKTELDPYGSTGRSCGTPWVIPSIPYSQSGLTTCFYGNEYTSANACSSQYMNGEDFVMRFNGTAGQCISIYTDNTFIYTGLFLLNGCPSTIGTTCVAYQEAAAGNPRLFNITLPSTTTYYIVMDMEGNTPPYCSPFDITVTPCVAVGQGATCASSFLIPSLPYSQIGFTTCGRGNTYNSTMACNSTYMNGEDFLFRYVSPGNECVSIELDYTQPYTGFFVYNGCPNLVGTTCIAKQTSPGGNPKRRNIQLTAAGTYYIMVSNQPAPNCTPFNFTMKRCPAACTHNPNASDLCTSATAVSFGPLDTVCGSTPDTYTPDFSVDLDNDFCGSIENNAWFSFVADSTRMTFRIDVPDCNYGYGIQAQVFETTDCINFTPRSNCWNPMLQSSGLMVATGLTPGNTYRIMLDGYATDDCSFRIYRIGGSLPVAWESFNAVLMPSQKVDVRWSTSAEANNRGFYIQRGWMEDEGNGPHFIWQNVGFVPGRGSETEGAQYQYTDAPEYTGRPWFYRVQQMDFDGLSSFSEIRQVNLVGPTMPELRGVYPNPADHTVNLEFYAAQAGAGTFVLYTSSGMLAKRYDFSAEEQGIFTKEIPLSELSSGIYFYAVSINGQVFKGKLSVTH